MTKTPTEEAVDLDGLQRLFERIPPGPYDALHRQDGWEVRQIDTDPRDKHHWPYRLCERIAGQAAECDDAVFPFIAGVINAWPTLLSELARLQAERDRAVEALAEIADLGPATCEITLATTMAQLAAEAISTLPPPVKEAEPEPVAWTGRTHDLKTWPTPFDAVAAGLKTWELRLNDRDYQVGDRLRLRRWVPVAESYSGEETTQQVVWLMKGPAFGLPEGYVIMSLAPPALQARVEALETELISAARFMDIARRAIESGQVVDKDVHGTLCRARDRARAALTGEKGS